ncbi:hypothetical protein B0H13DRAFT_1850132 [Mycena leptocephala]|nr:hypothetical protein B0H13DRAFT_1850132 [Mycena leptocephala]
MNADVFILALDIDDLKNRPKNTEEPKSIAAQRIAAMENEPDDATSAVIKDRNGVTLACVFARKSANVTKIHGPYPGTEGRSLAQFSGLSRNEEKYDLFICFPICAEISRHSRSFSLVLYTEHPTANESQNPDKILEASHIPHINCHFQPHGFEFTVHRKQIPLALCYATTFNGCQGLTVQKLGLDLRREVFSHGQLYSAMTRVPDSTNVLILKYEGDSSTCTANIVWQELLL